MRFANTTSGVVDGIFFSFFFLVKTECRARAWLIELYTIQWRKKREWDNFRVRYIKKLSHLRFPPRYFPLHHTTQARQSPHPSVSQYAKSRSRRMGESFMSTYT